MKKFISVLLCLVLVTTSMSIAVSAASTVNVVIDTTTATAGETVKVPVRLLNNSGVMGFKLIFDYDASVLTPVSVEYGAAISSGLQDNIEGNSVPGKMCVIWVSTKNVTAEGIWFYINFKVNSKSNGRTAIQVSYSQADTFNGDFEDVVFNCTTGYVTVSTVNVVIGTTTATAGETVKVPVRLLNNSGVMGFKLIFDYDASVLTPVSVEYGAAISSGLQDNIEGDSVPGKMCVYWAGTENVTTGGIWFYINFEVNSDSKGRTPVQVSYDQADTFNEDFEDVVFNCVTGYVAVGNSSYSTAASFSLKGNDISAGEDFDVTVKADTLTAVSPIELKINYNSQVFDFKRLEAKGIKATSVEGDGVLTITITGASEEYSGTDILTLHFASSENTVGGKYEFTAVSTINNENVYCKACSFYVVGGSQSGSVIYADDFYALPGETVEIPVYISNNTGIMGFRLNFTYNADLITPVSVTRGDVTALGAFNDSIGTTDQNTFSVVWNNDSEVYLNGKLLTLTFKVNENAPYGTADIGVSFSQGDTFNESYGDVKLICNDIEGAVTNMVPVLKADTTVKPTEGYVYSSVTACNNISQMLTPRSGNTLVGAPNSTGYFGTGTKVSAKNSSGAVVENYTIVITADVNGDSAADALDAALVSMVANGKADLEGAYHQACDFNANDFIDVEDYQSIVNYIVA